MICSFVDSCVSWGNSNRDRVGVPENTEILLPVENAKVKFKRRTVYDPPGYYFLLVQ